MAALSVTDDLDRYERVLRAQGFSRIAGADEAGRGALAGPLVAAAVILPVGFDRTGIRDSKVLSRNQREEAYERLVAGAVYAVAKAEPGVIDSRGLHRCNLFLLRRAAKALEPEPDYVLTDGFPVPKIPFPSLGIKKGDAVAASVAAASIVAKVTRDRIMDRHAPSLPGVRLRPQHGLWHPRPPGGARPPRAHADPPPVVLVRGSALAPGPRHGVGGCPLYREKLAVVMSDDDIERFEEERELELYREYRDVLPMFTYVIETERRFYLANKVDVQHMDGGWIQVDLIDAWVWDMFRPARFVSSVRVMTRRDVNVEELARRDETTTIPDPPTIP